MNDIEKTVKNLRKLGKFIEKGEVPPKLDMRLYAVNGEDCFAPQELAVNHECGTSACALGHAAIRWPKKAKEYAEWALFGEQLFPALYRKLTLRGDPFGNRDWYKVFDEDLSSDRTEVVRRLYGLAIELENR